MSPAGMSPSYPHSEPSPDPISSQYLINRMPRPPSSSPPLTPQPTQGPPSTMMGQLMGALNNSAILDDLNINVESLQGEEFSGKPVFKSYLVYTGFSVLSF